jgi:hypothetical protein
MIGPCLMTLYPLVILSSYVDSLTDQHWSIVYQTMKDTEYPPNELCMDGNAAHCVKSHCFNVGFDWLDLIYRWNKETTLFLISVVITIHCFLVVPPLRWFFCLLGPGSFHFVLWIARLLGALVYLWLVGFHHANGWYPHSQWWKGAGFEIWFWIANHA